MTKFGFSQAKFEVGKTLVKATESKNSIQEKERGEAQQATLGRDNSADE